jgi:hypothetical protein
MLSSDIELKSTDLQLLASAEAIVSLFANFGYNTEARLKQTPEAMDLTSIEREIKRIELIADQEQGYLQVYLIELKRLTVANIKKLAQSFKKRSGIFLLVLTTDYDRLDFVLLDPPEEITRTADKPCKLSGEPQIALRPRVLTVERRNPDAVALRVLRRFSYTESDADYQLDKLRSAYSVAEWSEPLFNNRGLFSDYYLNERLPQRSDWKEDPRTAYRAINDLLVDARQKYARQPENKLRTDLFEPIFKMLGWTAKQNRSSKDGSVIPDYDLITSSGLVVPCLTYVWDRSLDGPDGKNIDQDTPTENPAQSVVSILDALNADAPGWAIITNGKIWRLYSARAHSRATNYYEIDLEETLASPDVNITFRYFWLFFRARGFDAEPLFPDSLLSESASYAKALGERLKNKVFEDVFPRLAEGFIHSWGRPAVELNDEELRDTFHATLIFLYRLLFLLYAEARDLLPVKETRGYWEISLKRLKDEIAKKGGDISDLAPGKLKETYSARETELYDHMSRLFQVVDRGDADLNMPVYNGGLFITLDEGQSSSADEIEAEELRMARFLTEHKIPDRFLAQGLDLLTRDIDDKTQSLAMIDYKSLGVRQLGSIYEGLLEFKLRVAREKMTIVASKKGDQIIPYAEAKEKGLKLRMLGRGTARAEFVYHKGDVYLENDLHERKATGSYYTPDYIVKYIVQNTVGPALEAKTEALRPKLREAQKAYHAALERQKAFQKLGQKGDDPGKTAFTYRSLVDELFDLRVLDPAMGSGHFLVEAVDFITDRLLAFLNAFPWNPVIATLRQTRQTILGEMQNQGVNIDPTRLTDVNLLKRHVLKRCIYGVDLNPMAVELAKVSLWLDCFTLGAPLSFLDHHLKCGNSLIGAQVTQAREEIEMITTTRTRKVAESAHTYKTKQVMAQQFQMFGSLWAGAMLATDLMRQVSEMSDTTAEQIQESRVEYQRATDALAPFKRILDVYTSRWFGNSDTMLNQPALQFLRDEQNIPWLKDPQRNRPAQVTGYHEIANMTLKAARRKRFFHWELEFPEVFFGPSYASAQEIVTKDNPGFDAVIGNPPYVNANELNKSLSEYEKPYWKIHFKSADGAYDLYILFIEKSLTLCKRDSCSALITPNKYLSSPYAVAFRGYFSDAYKLVKLLNLSRVQVFDDPAVYPIVTVWQNQNIDREYLIQIETPASNRNLEKLSTIVQSSENLTILPENIWGFLISEELPFILKAQIISDQLKDVAVVNASSTASEADAYESALTDAPSEKTKKFINTGLIDRFETLWGIECLTHKGQLYTNPYLDLSSRVISKERISQYNKPKIIFAKMAKNIEAFLDDDGDFSSANTNFAYDSQYSLHYLVAALNSKLSTILYGGYFGALIMSGGYFQFQAPQLRILPIRRIAFTTPVARRAMLMGEAKDLTGSQDLSDLIRFVKARLDVKPEEGDVVHDLLAYLAQHMINLNKQKQAEMKHLLTVLEGLLKVSVDALVGKSRIKNYLGDYQKGELELTYAELEDILFKNKGKLKISLSDSRLQDHLRTEYESSLKILRPIKASLAWTDWLIDQIVYRLYGLTDEEIAIVEGKPVPMQEAISDSSDQ